MLLVTAIGEIELALLGDLTGDPRLGPANAEEAKPPDSFKLISSFGIKTFAALNAFNDLLIVFGRNLTKRFLIGVMKWFCSWALNAVTGNQVQGPGPKTKKQTRDLCKVIIDGSLP